MGTVETDLGDLRLRRVEEVRRRRPDDPAAAEAIRAAETEIDICRRFSDHYSYTFSVVQPVG